MRGKILALLVVGTAALAGCTQQEDVAVAPAAPIGPGAIAGTVAADRNGDGIIDGYYTSDGIYNAFQAPPCPEPAPLPPRRSGERG